MWLKGEEMDLCPLNRHLLLELISNKKEDKEKTTILVPEDYKIKSLHDIYRVCAAAPDCKLEIELNCLVVVDNSMVQEININNLKFYLLLENHVLGTCKGE